MRHIPPDRTEIEAIDWDGFEDRFGVGLPSDYKELVEAYGAGRFGDFLVVFIPRASSDFLELAVQRGFMPDKIDFWLEYGEVGSSSLPIDPGLLLPVAGTDNGNTIYWVTDPLRSPDDWTIAVDQARSDGWYMFQGGIAEFILHVFVDRRPVSVFPDGLLT